MKMAISVLAVAMTYEFDRLIQHRGFLLPERSTSPRDFSEIRPDRSAVIRPDSARGLLG